MVRSFAPDLPPALPSFVDDPSTAPVPRLSAGAPAPAKAPARRRGFVVCWGSGQVDITATEGLPNARFTGRASHSTPTLLPT